MLTVVGSGYSIVGQFTAESLAHIKSAEKLFYLVPDPITEMWIKETNRTAESLRDSYGVGRPRIDSYEEMVERILTHVRRRRKVCAVFYGHPGVFCYPGHESVRRARLEGYPAVMLPGISAQDCLFADLEIDPSQGLRSFSAHVFLTSRRRHDPHIGLLLWQIGVIGVRIYKSENLWSLQGLRQLVKKLRRSYPDNHEVVLYENALFPTCDPMIERLPLAQLAEAPVTIASTLYVPAL